MATKNIGKFKKVAQDSTALCLLQSGREKIETEEVAGQELTITAFDFAPKFDDNNKPIVNPETGEVETYGVITFKELPDRYYNCGVVFSKVCRAWMAGYETAAEASADLEAEGGVRVRFTKGKTKKTNRDVVTVEII